MNAYYIVLDATDVAVDANGDAPFLTGTRVYHYETAKAAELAAQKFCSRERSSFLVVKTVQRLCFSPLVTTQVFE